MEFLELVAKEPDKINSWLIILGGFSSMALIIWIFLKTGVVETSKQHKARLKNEAEEFEAMTPEVQQLHLHAKNKMAEFNFSIVMFVITCIVSGAFIYWAMK